MAVFHLDIAVSGLVIHVWPLVPFKYIVSVAKKTNMENKEYRWHKMDQNSIWPGLKPFDGLLNVWWEDWLTTTHASIVTLCQRQEHLFQLLLDFIRKIVPIFFRSPQLYCALHFANPRIWDLWPAGCFCIRDLFPHELLVISDPVRQSARCVMRELFLDRFVSAPNDGVFVLKIPSYLNSAMEKHYSDCATTRQQTIQ